MRRVRARQEYQFFGALFRAAPGLAYAWWLLLALRGLLPAGLAVATGALIGAVQSGSSLAAPLTAVGIVFVLFQVLTPLHLAISANLGSRTAAYLYDRLMTATTAPPGIAHLENPDLTTDLTVARDFDLGITGPPLSISMDFIASGLVEMVGGFASGALLFAFAWWAAPLLIGAWLSTHYLLRESAVWRDRNTDEVRTAQRHAEYAYRLAVDAPAAKEVRLFGLSDWVIDRFTSRRRNLYELQWKSTRLRERPLALSMLVVLAANALVAWSIADAAGDGRISLDRTIVFLTALVGTSMIAFGGWSWALDGSAAPVVALARLEPRMAEAGALTVSSDTSAETAVSTAAMPAREIRFRDVTFAYRPDLPPVLEHFDLVIPAGSSLAIVGVNGAGKTTLAKLLCRLYDPQSGSIEIDGVDLRDLDIDEWRARVTAVFQDFVRYERSLRVNIAPRGAPDAAIGEALREAGADDLADLDTVLAKAYADGIDLSGGQWQRVALARTLCAVRLGAGVVLLDEPTAQLDVRGEAEIFARVLAATRHTTTILVSHRFSTVRQADRICVVDHGRVVELGSHNELMAQRGRYQNMFDLQASRFSEDLELDEHGEQVVHETLA
jgi:ABC-type multidrug transport system fused ATPase/permease subunit